jgi:hypothetical protein
MKLTYEKNIQPMRGVKLEKVKQCRRKVTKYTCIEAGQ